VQGEICARGYQTMHAYYEMPIETAATLKPDGWPHMGDLGTMHDRGFIREIEDLLFTHQGIEAIVVGILDPTWGEHRSS
jgi:fatty-acyl-CoA synthase